MKAELRAPGDYSRVVVDTNVLLSAALAPLGAGSLGRLAAHILTPRNTLDEIAAIQRCRA